MLFYAHDSAFRDIFYIHNYIFRDIFYHSYLYLCHSMNFLALIIVLFGVLFYAHDYFLSIFFS